jgi:hypothetical protein
VLGLCLEVCLAVVFEGVAAVMCTWGGYIFRRYLGALLVSCAQRGDRTGA